MWLATGDVLVTIDALLRHRRRFVPVVSADVPDSRNAHAQFQAKSYAWRTGAAPCPELRAAAARNCAEVDRTQVSDGTGVVSHSRVAVRKRMAVARLRVAVDRIRMGRSPVAVHKRMAVVACSQAAPDRTAGSSRNRVGTAMAHS